MTEIIRRRTALALAKQEISRLKEKLGTEEFNELLLTDVVKEEEKMQVKAVPMAGVPVAGLGSGALTMWVWEAFLVPFLGFPSIPSHIAAMLGGILYQVAISYGIRLDKIAATGGK